ncbi:hypothetical protein P7L75_04105 (plasmid) [Tistrella mobilis]|uniref:hypothetical protein n=1 Tax=Tistrella mobilis TaxID=171437 RepID=UPI0035573A45
MTENADKFNETETLILNNILEIKFELIEISNKFEDHRNGKSPPPFPYLIDAGNERAIVISEKIEKLIFIISRTLYDINPSLAGKFTHLEWSKTVRKAFGPALAETDLNDNTLQSAANVLNTVKKELIAYDSHKNSEEYSLGCILFQPTQLTDYQTFDFSIGPIRFESRDAWLRRKVTEKIISPVTERRLLRRWNGERLKKRQSSSGDMEESRLFTVFADAPFIVSVTIENSGWEAGLQKSLTAARLSLSSVSLLFSNPVNILDSIYLMHDKTLRTQKIISVNYKSHEIRSQYKWSQSRIPLATGDEVLEILNNNSEYFIIIERIINYATDSPIISRNPHIISAMTQALLWFHEACRETVTLMAIVKLSSSLDAMAAGRKSGGIKRLISARLGIREDQPLWDGGPIMKSAVDDIYSQARSRTVHGTNTKIGHDWTYVRSVAEWLTASCLLKCLEWAAKHPGSDDPKLMSQ